MMEEKKEQENIAEDLFSFIQKSPTAFQAVLTIRNMLDGEGFVRLREEDVWNIRPGGSYYVTRNDSSIIAFTIPDGAEAVTPFRILASHSDSPSFKLKEKPEVESGGVYVSLNVEQYGGALMAPWLDRPLSIAGRILFEADGALRSASVHIDRDLVLIPNLAIHMNRKANDGYAYDPQTDMLPLFTMESADRKTGLLDVVAEESGVMPDSILGHDLFLYNRQPGTIWGAAREFISAPRLDDLQCAFASLRGFLTGPKKESVAAYCVFDNEEVGSETRQGAASTFLQDTLRRISEKLGGSYEDYCIALSRSFMISADNAHAVHPNHPDVSDQVNRPLLNRGIVLKFNASQKYCTDAVSAAMCRQICRRGNIPFQVFANRSDIAGGSTLGNISGMKVPVRTADIGLPQLAMHSPYETAGIADTGSMIRFAKAFFC